MLTLPVIAQTDDNRHIYAIIIERCEPYRPETPGNSASYIECIQRETKNLTGYRGSSGTPPYSPPILIEEYPVDFDLGDVLGGAYSEWLSEALGDADGLCLAIDAIALVKWAISADYMSMLDVFPMPDVTGIRLPSEVLEPFSGLNFPGLGGFGGGGGGGFGDGGFGGGGGIGGLGASPFRYLLPERSRPRPAPRRSRAITGPPQQPHQSATQTPPPRHSPRGQSPLQRYRYHRDGGGFRYE